MVTTPTRTHSEFNEYRPQGDLCDISLPVRNQSLYIPITGEDSPVRFDSLNVNADSRYHSAERHFCVRKKPYHAQIMVGRDGEAFAPAGFVYASLSTLSRPATLFDSGAQVDTPVNEATDMVTTPAQTHSEFIWRFWSCQKHRYLIVLAATESEARSQLPDAPCIFSARFAALNRPVNNYWHLQAGAQ